MVDIIKYPHVDFLDVTEDMGDVTKGESETELWQCYFNKTYIGFIGWDESVEQYAFFPVTDDQLILTFPILDDIMLKIYALMKDRRLN